MTNEATEQERPMTVEQEARDLLERAGVDGAQSMSSGDLVEVANLIVRARQREEGDEALSLAQRNALDQYSRVVEIVAERMPVDATFDPVSVAAHLRWLLEPDGEQDSIFAEIRAERARQDAKWGRSFPDRDWDRWVTILVEEVGEFAEAVLELPYDGSEAAIRKELIQSAAVCVSALEFGAPQGSQAGAGGDGRAEPPADTVEGVVTLECSICETTVDVPAHGGRLQVGVVAEGWTFRTSEGWTCPDHPAKSATPDTEEDEHGD